MGVSPLLSISFVAGAPFSGQYFSPIRITEAVLFCSVCGEYSWYASGVVRCSNQQTIVHDQIWSFTFFCKV